MPIHSISPLDGRYEELTRDLQPYFSEWGLIRRRVLVEVEWLLALCADPAIPEARSLSPDEIASLRAIPESIDEEGAGRVKAIERTTRHDVKAIEYDLRERLSSLGMGDLHCWIHFACTSEDINNLAYALLLRDGVRDTWLPAACVLRDVVRQMSQMYRDLPMMAHTHGQPASPTTVGKELAVFVHRWQRQIAALSHQSYLGKINGAVGCFNAHVAAYPNVDWRTFARRFVEGLGLSYNPLTTQIESHDFIAEVCHNLARFNAVTIGFDRDIWSYVSLGYFRQRVSPGEVGSSTMPHKVNPIQFENSESNLETSGALLLHLASKLPISRLQRDLTDSSTLRNLGVAISHSYLGIRSATRGLAELQVDNEALLRDLDSNWEVLGEAIQTVMRKAGHADAYERLKAMTRGARMRPADLQEFIRTLGLPFADENLLLDLTPSSYTGLASELVGELEKACDEG